MIPIIVLKIQYQVIYNQSNLSFQTYFEEFTCKYTVIDQTHSIPNTRRSYPAAREGDWSSVVSTYTLIRIKLIRTLLLSYEKVLRRYGIHSRKVSNFIVCFMKHHVLTCSLHFNDYKSRIKWCKSNQICSEIKRLIPFMIKQSWLIFQSFVTEWFTAIQM